jgi:hypothetical protein
VSQPLGLKVLGEPTTRDGCQLRTALLLEANRIEEARRYLDSCDALKEQDPETDRLNAICFLHEGNRHKALTFALRAEDSAPERLEIARAVATARCANTLSPLVEPQWYLYPNPVDLDLVKEDDESIALLNDALEAFDSLSTRAENPRERELARTWTVACLCNQRTGLAEAERRCETILAENPTDAAVINWALVRGLSFHAETCVRELNALLLRGEGTSREALALAILMLSEGQSDEAQRILQDYKALFTEPQSEELRRTWEDKVAAHESLATTGDFALQTSHSDHAGLLIERAIRRDEWAPVERLFEDLVATTPPSPVALSVAKALVHAGRWEAIVPHLHVLLQFHTPESIRIAAYTAFNTGDSNRVLEVLERSEGLFPNRSLPRDLRVLKVKTLDLIGDAMGALRHAAVLASDSTCSISDKVLKASLEVRIGDVRAALPVVREAYFKESIQARDAISLVPYVASEDIDLARKLWRRAVKGPLPPELHVPALVQAFRLGIDKEAAPIFAALSNAPQSYEGLITTESIEEIIEHQQRWRENAENIERLYLDGALPIHVAEGPLGANLAQIYEIDAGNTQSFYASPAVMIRHGSRPGKIPVDQPIKK